MSVSCRFFSCNSHVAFHPVFHLSALYFDKIPTVTFNVILDITDSVADTTCKSSIATVAYKKKTEKERRGANDKSI